jgi:hypothetical protein
MSAWRALPEDGGRTLRIAGVSFGITALLGLWLAYQRAGVSPFGVPVFRHLLLFQDYYAVAPFLGILLAALFAPVRALGVALALWCARHVLAVALLTSLALAIGTHAVYHAHPLSMDEYSMVFQSRIFAEGKLAGHLPPALLEWLVPSWMHQFLRVNADSGAVVAGYWPGFSLLLAPFSALGMPWLLNPLIGGATVLVMHRLARELFDNVESAGYVVLLTLASPAITINALSYYSMPAHLLANAVFMLLVLRPTPVRALLAGLVGSLALVLHNPVPHLLFALPWIVWLAWRPDRARVLGALIAGYLPLCLLVGWGWPRFLENLGNAAALSALVSPAEMGGVLTRRLSGIVDWMSTKGPGTAQLATLWKLWLWAVPALVTVAALGAWRLRGERGPWLAMASSAVLTYAGYFLIPFDQGHGWGARYFHSAWLVLPLLAVGAMQQPIKAAAGKPQAASGEQQAALPGYLAGCALLSLAVLTTFRALQVEQFMTRHLAQLPAAASGSARVLIIEPRGSYFAWDLAQNDPYLRNEVIRLTSRGAQLDRAMMAAQFPQYELLASDRRGSVWGVAGR